MALIAQVTHQSILATHGQQANDSKAATDQADKSTSRQRQAFSLHEDDLDGTNSSGSSDVTVNAYSEGEYGILRVRRHARRNMPPLPRLEAKSHRNTIPDVPMSADTPDFEELLNDSIDESSLSSATGRRPISRASVASSPRMSLTRPHISPKGPRPCPGQRHISSQSISKAQSPQDAAAKLATADKMIDDVLDEIEQGQRKSSSGSSQKPGGFARSTSTLEPDTTSVSTKTAQSAYVTDVDSSEAERFVRDRDFSPRRKHFHDRLNVAQRQSQESGLVDPSLSEGSVSDSAMSDCNASAESLAVTKPSKREPSFIRVPSTLFPHTPAVVHASSHKETTHGRARSATITPLQMGVRRSARGTFWNPLPSTLRMPFGPMQPGQQESRAAVGQELPRFIIERDSINADNAHTAAHDDRASHCYTRHGFRATIYPRKPDDFAVQPRQPLSQEYLFADYATAANAGKQGRRRSMSLSSAMLSQERVKSPLRAARHELPPVKPIPAHARMPNARAPSAARDHDALCSWCSQCDGDAKGVTERREARATCCSGNTDDHEYSSSSCSCCSCTWCQTAASKKDDKRGRKVDTHCSICSVPLCQQCASRSAIMLAVPDRPPLPFKSILRSDSRPVIRCDSPSTISSHTKVVDDDGAQVLHIYPGASVLAPLPVLSPFYIDAYRFWPPGDLTSSSHSDGTPSTGGTGSADQCLATTSVIVKATITSQTSATARLCAPGEVLRRRRPISRRLSRQRRAAEILLELQDDCGETDSRHCESCYSDMSPQMLEVDCSSSGSSSGPLMSTSSGSDGESSAGLTSSSSSSPFSSTSSEAHTPPRSQYSFADCESPGKRLSAIVSPLGTDETVLYEKESVEIPSIIIGSVTSSTPQRRHQAADADVKSVASSTETSSSTSQTTSSRPALRSILKSGSDLSSRVSTVSSSTDARSMRMLRGTPSASISCYSTSTAGVSSKASTNGTTGATKGTSVSSQRQTTVKLIVPEEKPTVQRRNQEAKSGSIRQGATCKLPSLSGVQPLDLDSRLQREAHRKVRNDERLCTLDKLEGRSKKSSLFTQLQALRADAAPRTSGRRASGPATAQRKTTASGITVANGKHVPDASGVKGTTAPLSSGDDDDAAFPASPLTPTKAQLRALEHAYEVQQQQCELQNATDMRLADVMTGFDVGVVPSSRNGSRSGSESASMRPRKSSISGASSSSASTKTTQSGERVLHTQLRNFSRAVEARQVAKARCVDQ